MTGYALRRFVEMAIVLVLMSWAIYTLIGLMPGDPIDVMINSDPNLTSADAARLRALYGLDQPLWQRYLNWATAALSGDLGYSRLQALPVLEVLPPYLWASLKLMGLSFAFSVAMAIPLGVWAATRPYSKLDYAINLFCFAGISVPAFWLALLMIICFSVWLGVLPAGGTPPPGSPGFWSEVRYLVLPVATLTLAHVGSYTRFVRASMMEVLRQDFIRAARAKGVPARRVIWVHALRNAMIPVVTVIALSFGTLFSGALITETIFAYPGMGKLIFDSILGNDYNLALTALLFATFLTLAANFIADLVYAWLDPRISLTGPGGQP
jgi:peptide/nickel transport system permease protein